MKGKSIRINPKSIEVEYDQSFATSIGRVIEVFPNGRDKFLLPFPCFQIDCKINSGMSGGPVYNESGKVCGVIALLMTAIKMMEIYRLHLFYGLPWVSR
jgi:hypothetical protein